MVRHARRRLWLWLPALAIGAALFWTVALGLGGLSLMLLGGGAATPAARAAAHDEGCRAASPMGDGIVVHFRAADDDGEILADVTSGADDEDGQEVEVEVDETPSDDDAALAPAFEAVAPLDETPVANKAKKSQKAPKAEKAQKVEKAQAAKTAGGEASGKASATAEAASRSGGGGRTGLVHASEL